MSLIRDEQGRAILVVEKDGVKKEHILNKQEGKILLALEYYVNNRIVPTVPQISDRLEETGLTISDGRIYATLDALRNDGRDLVARMEEDATLKGHVFKRVTFSIPQEVLDAMKLNRAGKQDA